MIEVDSDLRPFEAVSNGKAGQFYWLDDPDAIPPLDGADIWYTIRQGDCVGMAVPAGTPEGDLPRFAMNWIAFRWHRVSFK